jgi:hypothetical protein
MAKLPAADPVVRCPTYSKLSEVNALSSNTK